MRRFLSLLALVAVVAVLATLATADTDFQSVDERAHFTFSYPSGQPRLISDGNDIRIYNEAWSDTTGNGIEADYYFSGLNAAGDSVGVWAWENLEPGKYFFVERSGTDTTFSVPRYVRLGFDTAPPNSVDSSAVKDGMILTRHFIQSDSLINASKFIKSGVVIDKHIAAVSGSKIASQTIEPGALAQGRQWFSAAANDSAQFETLGAARIRAPNGSGTQELIATDLDVIMSGDVDASGTGDWTFGHTGRLDVGSSVTEFQVDAETEFTGQVSLGNNLPDPIIFDGYEVRTRCYADSLWGTNFDTLITVPEVSDILAAGYHVYFDVRIDASEYDYNTKIGATWNRGIFAHVLRQDASNGDTVRVHLSGPITGFWVPFWLQAKGR